MGRACHSLVTLLLVSTASAVNGQTTPAPDLGVGVCDGLAYGRRPERVIVVSPACGDFSSIQAALDSITDATADHRYLVKIGPGIYTERVAMQPYVDLEGSGQEVTTIRWSGGTGDEGTVNGADHAELRFLTVERIGGSPAIAMSNIGVSPTLTHVTLRVTEGLPAIAIGNIDESTTTLEHCRLEVTGHVAFGAINRDGCATRFNDVVIDVTVPTNGVAGAGIASYEGSDGSFTDVDIYVAAQGDIAWGMLADASSPEVRSCDITIETGMDQALDVAHGIAVENDSAARIRDSTIRVTHATIANGFSSRDSEPVLHNLRIRTELSITSRAVHVHGHGSSWPARMSHLLLSVDGGDSYGVVLERAGSVYPCEIANSRIQVTGAFVSSGVHATDGTDVVITSSSIDTTGQMAYVTNGIWLDRARIRVSGAFFSTYPPDGRTATSRSSADILRLSNSRIEYGLMVENGGDVECSAITREVGDLWEFYPDTCPMAPY